MPKVDLVIARPVSVVWQYFTRPETWVGWWGGELSGVLPGWQSGATLAWGLGEQSTIGRFIPERECQVLSRWMESAFTFSPLDDRSTRVEIGFEPRGGASFSDGGLAHMRKLAASLNRLKESVERDAAQDV